MHIHTVYFWENTVVFFDFLLVLRSLGFRGHINLFGFYPTLAWKAIIESTQAVDSIAVGECELTLIDLDNCLKRKTEWKTLPGLAHRSDHKSAKLAHRPPAKDPEPAKLFPLDTDVLVGVLPARCAHLDLGHLRLAPP